MVVTKELVAGQVQPGMGLCRAWQGGLTPTIGEGRGGGGAVGPTTATTTERKGAAFCPVGSAWRCDNGGSGDRLGEEGSGGHVAMSKGEGVDVVSGGAPAGMGGGNSADEQACSRDGGGSRPRSCWAAAAERGWADTRALERAQV